MIIPSLVRRKPSAIADYLANEGVNQATPSKVWYWHDKISQQLKEDWH
jgi:hypothetical protein